MADLLRSNRPVVTDRRPILIVLHQEHSGPGQIGRLLQERGFRLDIRRPRFGQALPTTLADHAGAIVVGGPMSANDPDEFMRREIDWIGVPLREEKPFSGLVPLGADAGEASRRRCVRRIGRASFRAA